MKIYRVENSYGEGPYQMLHVAALLRNHDDGAVATSNTPTPWQDPVLGDIFGNLLNTHSFGFGSVAQLKAWFTKRSRNVLARHGLCVGVYDAPDADTIVSPYQAVFPMDKSRRVETLDLATL